MPFPNVRLASRPLHFLYLCDCSGSMAAQGKMQALNQAIRQSLPGMAEVARQNPEARLLVRAVRFADQARWHIAEPTPVEQLQWHDLEAGGVTAMGEALELVAAALETPPMEERALPPVLVLISDGQPTDDFERGLRRLLRQPWAQKAVRLAIALGHDADLEVLQQFIGVDPGGSGRSARRPLQASNATALAQYIQWASTAVVGAASMPTSRVAGAGGGATDAGSVPLPDLPPTVLDPTDDVGPLVW
ncbi:MAG: VWA domain-containing protein [Synechococcus sp.]|nr:VWA domain-containing protein [Synechococcus sp.]